MANVNIKFNGKEYLLSCEDGQEEHLEELSLNLNKKFNDLKFDLGNIGENKLLLISSIKVMDEYFETKYQSLMEDYLHLREKLEKINRQKENESKKEIEFSEKIDELNQETDSLLEEIDKWQM